VVVAKLGASGVLHEGEVDASNWMTALRATRQALSERPSLPPGASCSLDGNGVATVLDPGSRRKFVLSPIGTSTTAAGTPAAVADTPAAVANKPVSATADTAPVAPAVPAAPVPPPAERPAPIAAPPRGAGPVLPRSPLEPAPVQHAARVRRPETVSLVPDGAQRPPVEVRVQTAPTESAVWPHPPIKQTAATAQPAAFPPTAAAAQPAANPKKKKFQTVAFSEGFPTQRAASAQAQSAQPVKSQPAPARASAHPAASRASAAPLPSVRPTVELEVLLERNEDATRENPLCYRERAYLLPRGTTVPEAEAALRWKLADLQKTMEGKPRGAFVNLAVFDHRWKGAPERPPVITLQWRDWRNEVAVDYPAAARLSSLPPAPGAPHDDRLAEVFEALDGLQRLRTPAEALDFAVRLLEQTIPAEATSACLYDINTDELRFVALSGTGAAERQGQAVARGAGLFGQAVQAEHNSSIFPDVMVEPTFNPAVDGRPGMEARNILLRPIVREHALLGVLQLINRRNAEAFSAQDVNVLNYIAEQLAVFLAGARAR
jgi:hypothetical protein